MRGISQLLRRISDRRAVIAARGSNQTRRGDIARQQSVKCATRLKAAGVLQLL